MSSSDSIEELLDLLGNKTRRRILELLSKEPQYINQLIDLMDVGAQAIVRHLRRLEQCGLVRSYERASFGGPPRKYYTITNAMSANVMIGPNTFSLKLFSDVTGQNKYKTSVSRYDPPKSTSNALIDAVKLVLAVLNQEKPTKEVETAVNVLELLKKSLIE